MHTLCHQRRQLPNDSRLYSSSRSSQRDCGSKPVHVGTLTGTDLYTSVSDALVSLCPTPSQTTSATQCDETGSVSIGGIEYVDQNSLETGSLVVQIPTSGYNDSNILAAMINSIATSIQNSATSASGNNCFTVHYEVEELRVERRGLGFWDLYSSAMNHLGLRDLDTRDRPIPVRQHKTMCNAAWFHTAEYYNPFWRTARDPGPTDYINAEVSFHASNNDDFLCSFLDALVHGLALVAPEFIFADVELEEGINVLRCLADGTCSSGSRPAQDELISAQAGNAMFVLMFEFTIFDTHFYNINA